MGAANRPAALLIGALGVMALPCGALAGGAEPGDSPVVVMLASRGAAAEAALVAGEVGSQLADIPARLDTRWADAPVSDFATQLLWAREEADRLSALAVFWVDDSSPGRLFLFFPDAEGGRILVRDVGAGEESAEGRSMTVAVIVRGAVRGVLAGEVAVGEPAAVETPSPLPPDRGELLEFGLSYGLQAYSEEVLLVHGARLEAALSLAGVFRLFAAYRAIPPPRVVLDDLVVGVLLYPAELGIATRFSLPPWSVEAGVGAVLAVVDLDITAAQRSLVPQDDVRRVELWANPWVGVSRELGPVFAVFLRLSADVVVNHHRYVVDLGQRVVTVLDPWRVRPMVILGASFSVL